MRKFTFVLIMMLAYAGFTMAQTIENFECIKMNLFSAGPNGSVTVVPNPDTAGNHSAYCVKMVRGKAPTADAWAGFYTPMAVPVNLTDTKYVHLKVLKPRITPVCFKFETGTNPNTGDVFPMHPQTKVNAWEELVFKYTAFDGDYNQIVLIPDFESPALTLTEDITLYFDEMYVNNDSTVGSAPIRILEDYETIPLNFMAGGADDLSTLTAFTPNPDKSGVNLSDNVVKFIRDKDGVPWGGFWSKVSSVQDSVDVTTNKYVHVKVWKPRISPVFFKLEGGAAGTLEIESKSPQTKINQWEDIVWDFSTLTGKYPIIAFMPDKADPVALTEDITIYFDDIIVNNDPNPVMPAEQKISVDMGGAGLVAGDSVFISGTFGGVYGTWVQPGTNLSNRMIEDPLYPGLYSIYLHVADGAYAFKFFKVHNNAWNGGDPYAGGNRTVTVSGNANLVYTWGVAGVEVSTRENPLAGKIQMYPNPVRNELTVNSTSDIRKVIITNTLGKVVGNFNYSSNQNINTSALSKGMYFITFVGRDGNKITQKLIKD